jgi:hypothetical protein
MERNCQAHQARQLRWMERNRQAHQTLPWRTTQQTAAMQLQHDTRQQSQIGKRDKNNYSKTSQQNNYSNKSQHNDNNKTHTERQWGVIVANGFDNNERK